MTQKALIKIKSNKTGIGSNDNESKITVSLCVSVCMFAQYYHTVVVFTQFRDVKWVPFVISGKAFI